MAETDYGQIAERIDEHQLARGLGWFSIGLGLAELLAPRKVARLIGVRPHPTLMRLVGLREIASGIGILSRNRPATWLQARVVGDIMDLTLLSPALLLNPRRRGSVALATTAVAGVTALDVMCTQKLGKSNGHRGAIHIRRAVTINKSPEELYQFWHQFENLPQFMNHVESVSATGNNRYHWVVKGPAGTHVEWDAEIIMDRTNELIAWRSCEGADVDNAGTVRFEKAPGNRGTAVRVQLEYKPPGGALGRTAAMLFGEAPEKQLAVDMLRFKQLMETGEIARTEGQPAGRQRSTSRKFDDFVRA